MRHKREFDRSVTVRSNGSSVFVFNKSDIGGWGEWKVYWKVNFFGAPQALDGGGVRSFNPLPMAQWTEF